MSSASRGGPNPKNKKHYAHPNVKVYGNIQGLTAVVGPSSPTVDGGMTGALTKTH